MNTNGERWIRISIIRKTNPERKTYINKTNKLIVIASIPPQRSCAGCGKWTEEALV